MVGVKRYRLTQRILVVRYTNVEKTKNISSHFNRELLWWLVIVVGHPKEMHKFRLELEALLRYQQQLLQPLLAQPPLLQ